MQECPRLMSHPDVSSSQPHEQNIMSFTCDEPNLGPNKHLFHQSRRAFISKEASGSELSSLVHIDGSVLLTQKVGSALGRIWGKCRRCLCGVTALTQPPGLYNDPAPEPAVRRRPPLPGHHGWEGGPEPRRAEVLPTVRDWGEEHGQLDVDHHPQQGVRCDQVPGGGERPRGACIVERQRTPSQQEVERAKQLAQTN